MQPKIETFHLRRLSSGDNLALQVYQFQGKLGQKTYIQANLHGAEIVGNIVISEIFRWLSEIDPEKIWGEIWLVPACNPVGMNQRSHFFNSGRYNSYDGQDWNRIFWDYSTETDEIYDFAKQHLESEIETIYQGYIAQIKTWFQEQTARRYQSCYVPYPVKYQQTLQFLCWDANHVIDIHSSSNQGLDYLFTFPGQEEATKAFLLDVGIRVDQPSGYTFDEAFIKPWLVLEETFRKLGRNIKFNVASWTLELGSGMRAQPESVAKGVRGIKNYLVSQGIVKIPDFSLQATQNHTVQFVQKEQIQKYYAPTGGIIQNCVDLKTVVNKGDVIYQILELNKQGEPLKVISITAQTSGLIFDLGINQGVHEGEYVLTILAREDNNDR
ncbi:succinylglutamate desuccinylase/aspartoacylase family protein [Halothece sp. PCC 7418]|uniref:succinylglutamate desuccinylase/aspartoacylase family protein n=1 Tax=Halothece sp. (strain PCC 7418) TaxID=65093 RepID=UPI0002F6CF6E|nr:succinylglutamate desuccinylase/aspartoacylase family protein [Halothece sp. PCC 7418]